MRARVLAVLGLCACGGQFTPETLVDSLKVLAITADPPEVAPGQSATLGIVELDPSRPGGVTTVVWVGCEPDPIDFNRSACNDTSALLQPTAFADFPPGVRILGFGTRAGYASATTLFDGVDAGDPVRFNGTSGPALAVVIGEQINPTSSNAELRDLFTRVENKQVQSVFALTRVTVSEKPQKNQNPGLLGLAVDGVVQPTNAKLQVHAGQTVQLVPQVAPDAKETWVLELPTGNVPQTETLVTSWYSTGGRFSVPRVDLDSGLTTVFTAPGSASIANDPVPDKRSGTLWAVLRDGRGGLSQLAVGFYVCDDSSTPTVTAIMPPQTMGDGVVVTGTDLGDALDVVVGEVALPHASFSPGRNAFIGDAPPLPSGTYPVTLRAKNCSVTDTGLTYTVP
jgi:hypothetical protein